MGSRPIDWSATCWRRSRYRGHDPDGSRAAVRTRSGQGAGVADAGRAACPIRPGRGPVAVAGQRVIGRVLRLPHVCARRRVPPHRLERLRPPRAPLRAPVSRRRGSRPDRPARHLGIHGLGHSGKGSAGRAASGCACVHRAAKRRPGRDRRLSRCRCGRAPAQSTRRSGHLARLAHARATGCSAAGYDRSERGSGGGGEVSARRRVVGDHLGSLLAQRLSAGRRRLAEPAPGRAPDPPAVT